MSDRLQEATSEEKPKKGLEAWVAGRARRREYWAWSMPLTAALLVLAATGIPGVPLVAGIPMLLVWIRRLHDLGFTGWLAPLINVSINVLAYVATLLLPADAATIAAGALFFGALVVLGALPGQPRTNRYGRPPGKLGDVAETFS